jgi:hypothetical protein
MDLIPRSDWHKNQNGRLVITCGNCTQQFFPGSMPSVDGGIELTHYCCKTLFVDGFKPMLNWNFVGKLEGWSDDG